MDQDKSNRLKSDEELINSNPELILEEEQHMMQMAQQYFLDKGQRELPFVARTWQQTEEKEREAFLNGYSADFFNATIGRWDELARKYWRQFWSGF